MSKERLRDHGKIYPWISTFEVEGIQVVPSENEAEEQTDGSVQTDNKDGSIR